MENFKHTKGEWIYDCKSWINSTPMSYTIQLNTENNFSGKSIAKVDCICGNDFDRFHYEEAEANAKLIAAAPELLEALNWIVKANSSVSVSGYDKAINAIKKATQIEVK